MMGSVAIPQAAIVAHSFGGMIALAFAGSFPERVSRLAVLDGAFLPPTSARPIGEQIVEWVADLDKISRSRPHRYPTIEEAARRMSARNPRLTAAQALHLARHAVRKNADGSWSWKFDPYQRVRAPYRLSADDHVALWSRIACPTLFLCGSESFVPDPERVGILRHFRNAHRQVVAGAGHWLHHDRPDEVLAPLRSFLDMPV
jgi:pimeloyl-ACP methyl ester carboxylesterase